MGNKITTILCDFDGVMVNRFTELSVKDFCSASGIKQEDFARISQDAAQGWDTGQISTDQYFAALIEKLRLELTPVDMKKFLPKLTRGISKRMKIFITGWIKLLRVTLWFV